LNISKNAKSGAHKDIGQLIKPVRNKELGIELVMKSENNYAYVTTRDFIIESILRFGQKSFYSPPFTEDSSFYLDIMAIALQKEFKHKKEFNRLYVFIWKFAIKFKLNSFK
jgi:hypothetical protein